MTIAQINNIFLVDRKPPRWTFGMEESTVSRQQLLESDSQRWRLVVPTSSPALSPQSRRYRTIIQELGYVDQFNVALVDPQSEAQLSELLSWHRGSEREIRRWPCGRQLGGKVSGTIQNRVLGEHLSSVRDFIDFIIAKPEQAVAQSEVRLYSSSVGLLETIRSSWANHERLRQAVIEAEALPFTQTELNELLPLLRRIIEQFRSSTAFDDIVAVGSAVRKYVMNIPADELKTLHAFFDPTPTAPISFEVELELAKTVVWRLTAVPPDTDDALPELAEHLFDRAEGYMRPSLLLRENHAAVAQDAVIGLLLLRSHHVPQLLELLRKLDAGWFSQLLRRRVGWLRQDLELRFQAKASQFVRSIIDLEDFFKQ